MNQLETRKIIYSALKKVWDGERKAVVYYQFKDKIDKKLLAQQLALTPDKELSEKYHKLNLVYASILIFIVILKVSFRIIQISHASNPAEQVIILFAAAFLWILQIYLVIKKNAWIYRIVFLSGLAVVIVSILLESHFTFVSFILLIPDAAALFLSLFLGIKMFPYFGVFKPKPNADGELRYTIEP